MNMRDLTFLYEVRKLPKKFDEWREDLIKRVDHECYLLQELKDVPDNLIEKIIEIFDFPKTIVRLTRQMCSCSDYCLDYSMYYTKFNPECRLYDLDKLYEDEQYYRSGLIDKKVIYGRLEPYNFITDEFELKKDFNDLIGSLCKNEENSLDLLKCKTYELIDYCVNNNTCYSNMIEDKPRFLIQENNCTNQNFEDDLLKIPGNSKIYSELGNTRIRRDVGFDIEHGNQMKITNGGSILNPCFVSLFGLMAYFLINKNYKTSLILGIIGSIVVFGKDNIFE